MEKVLHLLQATSEEAQSFGANTFSARFLSNARNIFVLYIRVHIKQETCLHKGTMFMHKNAKLRKLNNRRNLKKHHVVSFDTGQWTVMNTSTLMSSYPHLFVMQTTRNNMVKTMVSVVQVLE
jgi:hypothetical protein